jgi:hypothetical protein
MKHKTVRRQGESRRGVVLHLFETEDCGIDGSDSEELATAALTAAVRCLEPKSPLNRSSFA